MRRGISESGCAGDSSHAAARTHRRQAPGPMVPGERAGAFKTTAPQVCQKLHRPRNGETRREEKKQKPTLASSALSQPRCSCPRRMKTFPSVPALPQPSLLSLYPMARGNQLPRKHGTDTRPKRGPQPLSGAGQGMSAARGDDRTCRALTWSPARGEGGIVVRWSQVKLGQARVRWRAHIPGCKARVLVQTLLWVGDCGA
jgi:hypothetical protein